MGTNRPLSKDGQHMHSTPLLRTERDDATDMVTPTNAAKTKAEISLSQNGVVPHSTNKNLKEQQLGHSDQKEAPSKNIAPETDELPILETSDYQIKMDQKDGSILDEVGSRESPERKAPSQEENIEYELEQDQMGDDL